MKEPIAFRKHDFRENLVRLRKESGMTQKELAEKAFVSRKTINEYERGLSVPKTYPNGEFNEYS